MPIRVLESAVAAQADQISAADAMRELAKARPNVWIKLKEQEANIRAEQDSNDNDAVTPQPGAADGSDGGAAGGGGGCGSESQGHVHSAAELEQQREETTAAMRQHMGMDGLNTVETTGSYGGGML